MSARVALIRHFRKQWHSPDPSGKADAVLTALGAAGYVVVPKEPTFEQQDRALHDMGCANPKMSRQQLRDFYRAMLAAAQEPTS